MNLYSPVISGSLTVTGSTSFIGNVTMTGTVSATASNATLLNGTGSVGFATTSSFTTTSGSVSSRITQIETVYATTGSNSFRATQSITGSLTVTGQITAQTLNVQQVTSSILYSSGSNVFGCDLNSRQTFTGSVLMTGSLNVFGNISSSGNLRIDKDQPDIQLNILSASQFSRIYFFEGASGNGGIQLIGSSFTGTRKCRFEIFGSNAGISFIANAQFENPGMFISGSNVGIGTINPLSRLHVNTGTNQNFRVRPGTDVGATNGIALNSRTDDDGSLQQLTLRASDVIMLTSGNVGIGTSSPAYPLDIQSNASALGISLRGRALDDISLFTFFNNAANTQLAKFTAATTYFGIDVGGSERMRITSAGRVGIATPNPGAQLDVCQMAGPGTSACDALYLRAGNNSDVFCHNQILFSYNASTDYAHAIKTRHNSNNAIDNAFDFYTWKCGDAAATKAGQYVMTIAGNGRVGIGTCAPSTTLHVAGNVTFNNTISSPGNFIATAGLNVYLRPASGNRVFIDTGDGLTVTGNISKGSGSFRIKHPLDSKKCTHRLVHSFIEGPQADLIYSGHTALQNGISCINMDCAARMTEGTFLALNRCLRVFTTNETSWDQVKGRMIGNVLIVESQNTESNDEISWMVIGERQDEHMLETKWTDEQGRVITEPEIIE